jgi:salicylate hydroxylase
MMAKLITIIGAGIGGLTAALALQRRGFKIEVSERGPEIRELGAGIMVSRNARRALRDLEIDTALEACSSGAQVSYICNYETGQAERKAWDSSISDKYGSSVLQVHRGDLHDLLIRAVRANDADALYAGHEFVNLEQDADGVTVSFANGARARGDALIGADGNASAVRSRLFPGEAPKFIGQVSFRALIPSDLVPTAIRERGLATYPGPKRMLMHYPLRGGTIMNLVGNGQSATWAEEGWSVPASVEEFVEAYAAFAPDLLALIRAIPAGGLFKWGLRDREPLKT